MAITDTGKKLIKAINESDKTAASQLALDLQGLALGLQEENFNLRRRIDELQQHIDLVDSMTFDGKVYWRGEGEERDGPFCQRCVDAEGRAIRLQLRKKTAQGYETQWYECHNCQSHIEA